MAAYKPMPKAEFARFLEEAKAELARKRAQEALEAEIRHAEKAGERLLEEREREFVPMI